jgi:hypothetical protein
MVLLILGKQMDKLIWKMVGADECPDVLGRHLHLTRLALRALNLVKAEEGYVIECTISEKHLRRRLVPILKDDWGNTIFESEGN